MGQNFCEDGGKLKEEEKDECYSDSDSDKEREGEVEEEKNDAIQNNVIVSSMPVEIFTNTECKKKFESMFVINLTGGGNENENKNEDVANNNHEDMTFSSTTSSTSTTSLGQDDENSFISSSSCSRPKFCYFKLFRRCCIQYEKAEHALVVKCTLDQVEFMNTRLSVFLSKPIIKLKNTRFGASLEPPKQEKAFLISPPASPPVGWEQSVEDPPVVNLELIAALSRLNPHEPCELIKSSDEVPGIVIHPCPDVTPPNNNNSSSLKFIRTSRPAYMMD